MKYIFAVLIVFMSFHANAKRKGHRHHQKKPSGPVVTVLNKNGIEYSPKMTKLNCPKDPEKFCTVKAALIAKVKATEEVKWERELYIKELNPNLSYESQEIKVHALRWKAGDSISVEDDRESEYEVNIETGEMSKPARAIIYPAAGYIPVATSLPTQTPAATPTPAPKPTPKKTATPAPSITPTPTPTPTATVSPTPTPPKAAATNAE